MIEKLNFKKIEKHGLSTNELFNKINEMISDINANSYLNSKNTIEMDNIIKRLELLEKKEGNSVAQTDDRVIIAAWSAIHTCCHQIKNFVKYDQAMSNALNQFKKEYKEISKARTTDKEQPE